MRDYGKVFTGFWSSPTTRALSDDGRLLALYLLTSHHTNMIGTLRLPDGYACEDLQWTPERLAHGFQNCLEFGFATRYSGTNLVVINNYLVWNPIENQNQAKAAIKLLESVPAEIPQKPTMVRVVAHSCSGFKKPLDEDYADRLQTLLKGFRNPSETSNSNSSSISSRSYSLSGEELSLGGELIQAWGGGE